MEVVVFVGRFLPSFITFSLLLSGVVHRLGHIEGKEGNTWSRVDTLENHDFDDVGVGNEKNTTVDSV